MISKIVIFTTFLAVVIAQYDNGHGHGHGHAVSSQSIVLHQSRGHAEHAPVIAHHAPVIAHHAPVVTHHAPVVAHVPVVHHQPTYHASHDEHKVEHYAPAHYSFEYNVEDKHTGDIKSQKETREGDVVHGSYSLHEADGTIRLVEYTADAHTGFNAVVHRKGHATHVVPVHQPSHKSYH